MSYARKKVVKRPLPPAAKEPAPETKFPWLKWVGGITAILSLIFGLRQATVLLSDYREQKRQVEELYTVGKAQQKAGDYPAAWVGLEQALKIADAGGLAPKLLGQVGQERRRLRATQEDLAMEWLQNIRIAAGHTFSETVDKLVFVLNRGIATEKGTRKADLLAHLGWAYFLKSRDSPGTHNPEQYYQMALEIDAGNPYALAHWAHWQLWQGGELAEAQKQFALALASGRQREYVRKMQLAAFQNSRSEEADAEFLRMVNDMRKNKESINENTRNHLINRYYFSCNWEDSRFRKLLGAVPATEQLQLFRELFYSKDFVESKELTRDACYATLLEAAGRKEEALKAWATLRENYLNVGGSVFNRSEAARKRLLLGR